MGPTVDSDQRRFFFFAGVNFLTSLPTIFLNADFLAVFFFAAFFATFFAIFLALAASFSPRTSFSEPLSCVRPPSSLPASCL